MKKISLIVPCFNERDNIRNMASRLTEIMEQFNGVYDYEIVFRDNASKDGSIDVFREIASEDSHIKVIVNARNYGFDPLKDTWIGRISGDVIISIPCDFQEPPELIPEFITYWEKGYEVVCGVKDSSEEGKMKYGLRQIYYKIIETFSDIPQYKNMSGIILVSRRLYDLKAATGTRLPWRYFLSDIGCDVKTIHYAQKKRVAGKSSYNIWRSLSFAIESMITTSVVPIRIATIIGAILSFASFIIGLVYLVLKIIFWERFVAGMAPMLIGLFFIGSVQLLAIGIVGEYVGGVLKNVTPKNPPIVKELINFDEDDKYLIKEVE